MLKDPVPLDQVKRVLVIKLRHHGDVLLTSPVMSVLKQAAPHLEIDALVYADTAEMLTLHPALSQVHVVDRKWKRLGVIGQARAEWQLLRTLKSRRYDLVIHLTEHWRGAWLSRLLRARWSVAFTKRGGGSRWKKCFTHLTPWPRAGGRHTVESHLDVLRRIGLQPSPAARQLQMVPGSAAYARVSGMLTLAGVSPQQFVHIHPASRWLFKCWRVEAWAELINRLQDAGWVVVLTAAPDPVERAMLADIRRLLHREVVDFGGRFSLKELAALTAAARLFVGVDSAPMHIAAAVGTPAIALFGPSGDNLWGPWGTPRQGRHRVIASPKERFGCRPCGIDGCGASKISDCLVALETDTVWQAVAAELGLAC